MITPEERQEIIDAAVEKALLLLPEVVGNLINNHVVLAKLNKTFYDSHPEFRDKKDVVSAVIEMVESKSPLGSYEEILKEAVPEIKKRIEKIKNINLDPSLSKTINRNLNGII